MGAEDPVRPPYSFDVGLVGGLEPSHGNLPDGTAALYGGDLRFRLRVVSLGVRLEKTAGFSSTTVDGFTRLLGTVGFNIGLGDQVLLSPYLGLGASKIDRVPPPPGGSNPLPSDETDLRFGLEVEYFLARYVSVGGGFALDFRSYSTDGVQGALSLSGLLRLSAHLPFG